MNVAKHLLETGEQLTSSLGRWNQLESTERTEVDRLLVRRSRLIAKLRPERLTVDLKQALLAQDAKLLELTRSTQKRARQQTKINHYQTRPPQNGGGRYFDQAH